MTTIESALSPADAFAYMADFSNARHWDPSVLEAARTTDGAVGNTFATFALRAGISAFDLSRYMGTSLGMIDRHYGHLARDGRQHAIRLLDLSPARRPTSTRWTLRGRSTPHPSPDR